MNKNRSRMTRTAVLVLGILLAGFSSSCGGSATNTNINSPTNATVSTEPRLIIDDLGRNVTIPARVARVVSLAPSVTETIFAAGGGDRLVGVTTFCNYPDAAKNIPKIGDTLNPNMETIVALKPDIVFVSTASQIEAFTGVLERNGITVFVSSPTTLDGILADIRRLGEILGTQEKANETASELRRRIGAVRERIERERRIPVFVQISREPLFTIGSESFLNEPIARAGGQSVTADVATGFPKLSKETASRLDPEVIILSAGPDNTEPNEVFASSRAVREGRVLTVDADLLSRPGPRLIDAFEQIAKYLHPDKFGDK